MALMDTWIEEAILLLLFIISISANSLALLVFCRRPGLRTISNRFVMNLLVTNLVTSVALGGGAVAGGSAELLDALAAGCSFSALLAVLLIAGDQHHAVTDPLRCHARLLQRRPTALLLAAWAAAALAAAARASLAALHPAGSLTRPLRALYAGLYLAACVAAPALAVCVLYARIYRAARSSGLRARAHAASALQLHEPVAPPALPDLAEESDALTLRIDPPPPQEEQPPRDKYGPFLAPPERPQRCPSASSLRTPLAPEPRRLPAVSSAPSLAAAGRISTLRCRISNASLFRYREESRAARVGALAAALVLLHVPHALLALASAAGVTGAAEAARGPALALLLLAAAVSPFLFALRSRRVQREARRLFRAEQKGALLAPRVTPPVEQTRAALELLRALTPGPPPPPHAARGSFSSGASTQLSSASDE